MPNTNPRALQTYATNFVENRLDTVALIKEYCTEIFATEVVRMEIEHLRMFRAKADLRRKTVIVIDDD